MGQRVVILPAPLRFAEMQLRCIGLAVVVFVINGHFVAESRFAAKPGCSAHFCSVAPLRGCGINFLVDFSILCFF